jgi:short-subunit dehydrogenase
MKDLQGKTAIVTGASRGIGPYIAKALAGRGVRLALAARSADKLDETRAACEAAGAKAIAVATDVTSLDDLRRLVEVTERELGPVDVLVNNAGIEVTLAVVDYTLDQVDAIVRTNLSAPIWLTKLVLPGMIARKRGAIVQISSMSGKSATAYNAIYAATKHGLNGFTSSLALELDGTGVTAGVVCPAFVGDAGMWANTGEKAPRIMREVSPKKVVAAVIRVIANGGEELVTPGPIKPLLAMQELMPGISKSIAKRMGIVDVFRERAMKSRAELSPEREPADLR